MIYTLTMNPAVDYYIETGGELNRDGVNRGRNEQFRAAGKGLNVSRDLSLMQIPSVAIALLGGFTGQFIEDAFSHDENITLIPIRVMGNNRVNVKMMRDGELIAVNGSGPEADLSVRVGILRSLSGASKGDTVIISGSMMPGLDDAFMIRLCNELNERGADIVMDAEWLRPETIRACCPKLTKRTLKELGELAGRQVREEEAETVLMETDPDGILLVLNEDKVLLKEDGKLYRLQYPYRLPGHRVGMADALMAAYVGKRTQSLGPEDALRWAGAMACAVTSGPDDTAMDAVMRLFDEMKTETV